MQAFDLQLASIGGEQMYVDDAVDDAPRHTVRWDG